MQELLDANERGLSFVLIQEVLERGQHQDSHLVIFLAPGENLRNKYRQKSVFRLRYFGLEWLAQ